ncbi:MAG: hypothetical protein OXG52_12945 [bacterium]|nr:hypothetical protein [bacterium]
MRFLDEAHAAVGGAGGRDAGPGDVRGAPDALPAVHDLGPGAEMLTKPPFVPVEREAPADRAQLDPGAHCMSARIAAYRVDSRSSADRAADAAMSRLRPDHRLVVTGVGDIGSVVATTLVEHAPRSRSGTATPTP